VFVVRNAFHCAFGNPKNAKRRAFPQGAGSKAIRDLLLISIDLSDFHVEKFAG